MKTEDVVIDFQDNSSAARTAGRFDRTLAASHGGEFDDRERHGRCDGGWAARAQSDQHDAGHIHARVRWKETGGEQDDAGEVGKMKERRRPERSEALKSLVLF